MCSSINTGQSPEVSNIVIERANNVWGQITNNGFRHIDSNQQISSSELSSTECKIANSNFFKNDRYDKIIHWIIFEFSTIMNYYKQVNDFTPVLPLELGLFQNNNLNNYVSSPVLLASNGSCAKIFKMSRLSLTKTSV